LKESHVGVVGAGYVGLVAGVCLAHLGHRVIFIDVDAERRQPWGGELVRGVF
jgi:UDPglucose 6-dehydrogenase